MQHKIGSLAHALDLSPGLGPECVQPGCAHPGTHGVAIPCSHRSCAACGPNCRRCNTAVKPIIKANAELVRDSGFLVLGGAEDAAAAAIADPDADDDAAEHDAAAAAGGAAADDDGDDIHAAAAAAVAGVQDAGHLPPVGVMLEAYVRYLLVIYFYIMRFNIYFSFLL